MIPTNYSEFEGLSTQINEDSSPSTLGCQLFKIKVNSLVDDYENAQVVM